MTRVDSGEQSRKATPIVVNTTREEPADAMFLAPEVLTLHEGHRVHFPFQREAGISFDSGMSTSDLLQKCLAVCTNASMQGHL